jgi:hypothetical protein
MASAVNFGTEQYFGFDPRTIPGCSLWLDAADATTLTTNGGGNVTQWTDKSGTGATMTPIGTQSNATLQTNYQNGLTALSFSGLNMYRTPTNTGVYPSDVYILVALKSLSRMDVMAIGSTGTDNFNSLTFGEYTSLRWHNGSSGFSRTPNTVSPTNETSTSLLLMNWSLSNNNFVLRRNGTQLSSTSSYTYGLTAPHAIQIGFRHTDRTNSDLNLSAYIAEVVVYNRQLELGDRQEVEGYLAWKWALTSSLPNGHPYKPYPPAMRIFQPVDISGAILWLDAADATTMTLSGTTVTQWRDKSGNGNIATAAGNAAVLSSNSIAFTGTHNVSSTRFTIPDTVALRLNAPFTIYMAYAATVITATGDNDQASAILLSKFSDDGVYAGWAYRARDYNPPGTFTAGFFNGAGQQGDVAVTSSNVVDGTRKIIGLNQQTSTTMFTFVNGSADLTITPMAPPPNATHTFMIGARNTTHPTRNPFNGFLNEIIIHTGSLSRAQCQQIEGYLAAKWGLQGSLPTTHPYYRVLPSTPLFTPTALPGCVLWLDPTDPTTLTLSGSSVTQWRDKSGLGVVFSTVNANPIYTASLINGLPALDLTNGSGFISTVAQTLTSSLTLAMVLVVKSGLGFWGSFFTHGSRDGDIALERNSISSGTTLHFQTANDNSTGDITFTTDQVALYLGTMTTGTSRFFERFGGGTTTTTTATNSSTITTGLQLIRIGRSDVGENCNSYLGEIVYYNRVLTTQERQQLEGYLLWKWGLTTSLPSTHPYAKFRP